MSSSPAAAPAYRSTGPVSLRPVGETEFVADVARHSQQRGVKTQVCAGIVGYADLTLGDEVEAVLQAHIDAAGGAAGGRQVGRGVGGFAASVTSWRATMPSTPACSAPRPEA